MRERRHKAFSIRGPAILFAVMLVLIVTLTVLWNVVLVKDYRQLRDLAFESGPFHWTFIALGSALFLAIIVIACILGFRLIANLRRSHRQSRFLATVTHELNSPLSSIKLFAQTLRRPDLEPGDRTSFLTKLLFDVDRLSRIIANILRATELDHRGEELTVVPQELDLTEYLREYIKDAAVLYRGRVELTLDGERDVRVEIDPMMFRQVLDNLVDNAVRYRRGKCATVAFRIERFGGWAELNAIDQGIGIPAGVLPNIFDRFYRAESEDREPGRRGMGIGLSVVRSIVQSHGGRVGARSDGPGRGTVIWIRLPRVETSKVPV